MSLMARLQKNSKIKESSILEESQFFLPGKVTKTDVLGLNIACSGDVDIGFSSGLTVMAGPSKHFKTSFTLVMLAAYLRENPDGICLFYDSEFGSPQAYFESYGIDTSRVFHTPIKNIEAFKFDIMNQVKDLTTKDKVIIVVDSIGNLASIKEIEDALAESGKSDMTRAKQLKGLFRMVTPELKMKDIPMIAINHTYQTMEMFSKSIVSGGTGITYSADSVFIIGRRQNKKGTTIEGYDFVINIEKSRFVKEKTKIPITVTWDGGIEKYSGLRDIAMAGNYVVKPSNGWYQAIDPATGEEINGKVREKGTLEEDFWTDIFAKTDFKDFIRKTYQVGQKADIEVDFDAMEVAED